MKEDAIGLVSLYLFMLPNTIYFKRYSVCCLLGIINEIKENRGINLF